MKEVKWGIIGCGAVCEVKSGPALQKAERSSLVAVMRRDRGKAQDFARRHDVPAFYDDADDLINDENVNAVYIATPPAQHLEYVRKVAAAGKPVYVEKPMGRNFAECEAMIKACADAGVPLFVAYYRRKLSYFLKVKELVDSGKIGQITAVNIQLFKTPKAIDKNPDTNWRIDPKISGGGYFHDLASHQLDLLDFLFGEIKSAGGFKYNALEQNDAEDTVVGNFQFASGIVGSGFWSFTSPVKNKKDIVEILGTTGKITFSSFDGADPVILENETEKIGFDLLYPMHVQQPLVQSIVDELTGGIASTSTGISAARTNWIMDRILGNSGF